MSDIINPPIHPGEILLEVYIEPLGLSQNKLAEALDVDPGRINRIVTGKSSITADTALRLARYFQTHRVGRATAKGFTAYLQNQPCALSGGSHSCGCHCGTCNSARSEKTLHSLSR